MLIKRPADCLPSEITPLPVYQARRQFLKQATGLMGLGLAGILPADEASAATAPPRISGLASPFSTDESPTPLRQVSSYNNFYEFGTDKSDPVEQAQKLRLTPWTLRIEGLVRKPLTLDLDGLMKLAPTEERIYRLRCVEGWSMVIPWLGIPLAALLNKVDPLGSAKYVEFTSAVQPENMIGVQRQVLDWPYVEGLRLDEARHPLTLLSFGLYGDLLPKQNGAPIRLVVPWKYGFKSAKSLVRIRLLEQQPLISWEKANPREYGFYSNVNPGVDHPRWSQAKERRIGEFSKRETRLFNGYDQVASLYGGMDLRKNF